MIKELSALDAHGCRESVTVDLGVIRNVGVVRTRHWAGPNTASGVSLLASRDGFTWEVVARLQPEALHAVNTRLSPAGEYRYISLEYNVVVRNYNKVYCWEIDAYDVNGKWGSAPSPQPHPSSLRTMLGVNGIWGWGHSKYSNLLNNGEGPTLFNQIASHARNYHNLDWDVQDPDFDPEFDSMSEGHGTNAKWWLNWDQEYLAWTSANLTVDASIQFTAKSFPPSKWNTAASSSYHYGREFARHFGPEVGNGYVTAMEIGNEPWDYSSEFYSNILENMAAGARSIDSVIHVLPCALQAHEISPNEPTTGNYIGTRVKPEVATNISVINTHAYSFMINGSGVRIATYPEHEDSEFNSIRNIIRWRDINTPLKPIWLTEWGWDANGKGENCVNTECVSEDAQAVYGIRGLFILSRLGIEKVTWYFYANTNCETLFCRSGLTTSVSHNFTKKAVFHAFTSVINMLGNSHFLNVLSEDNSGYVYSFGTDQTISHLVAWLPLDVSDQTTSLLAVNVPGYRPLHSWRLATSGSLDVVTTTTTHLHLSSKPLIVELEQVAVNPPVIG